MVGNKVQVFNFEAENFKDTIQTPGMLRKEIFADDNCWVGFVQTEPESIGGWHHHGEYNTFVCVIKGFIIIDFGGSNQKSVHGSEGNALFVPKGLIHREKTPSSEKGLVMVIRVGKGNPVINVESQG